MSQAPANPLKGVAAITAVITLVLGLNQVVRVFGWAYFLKSRDRGTDIDPALSYGKALAIDPENLYANAFLAHWIVWQRGSIDEANRHFAAALAGGREHDFVRRLQLAALRN